jgi:hypothetical protein
MPTRWSYESLVFAQAKLNPLTRRQEKIQSMIYDIVRQKNPTTHQEERLEDLKDTLALLSGLEASTPSKMNRAFGLIDQVIDGAPFDRSKFKKLGTGFTAEQLYEMEQSDYRENRHLNVFFGPVKEYLGLKVGMLWFNVGVLLVSSFALFWTLYLILRNQIRMRIS